jgi:hypothetical protein
MQLKFLQLLINRVNKFVVINNLAIYVVVLWICTVFIRVGGDTNNIPELIDTSGRISDISDPLHDSLQHLLVSHSDPVSHGQTINDKFKFKIKLKLTPEV